VDYNSHLSGPSNHWYSRLEINGYKGPVTVTWKLQQKAGLSSWKDTPSAIMTTSIVLSGSVQNVYATNDGVYSSANYDWRQDAPAPGTDRVVTTVMA